MASCPSHARWATTQRLPIDLPALPLPPGVHIGGVLAGKYRLECILGTGATGVVVGATHLQLDQRIAIKFLSPSLGGRSDGVRRFMLEARNAARIGGEHVVRIFDVATLDDGSPYAVMEYLEGEDLRQLLDRRGPLPLTEAVEYILQAGEAIAEAHVAGIVHRDLQPGNLFRCTRPDGSSLVKVLDFGASKLLVRADATMRPVVLTGPYFVAGLPLYSAPEQFHSPSGGDARVDIWALGAILYELVVGRAPFSGETAMEIFSHVAGADPLPMHVLRPDVPTRLDAAVARALAKEPTARPATVAELARSLAPFADRRSLVSLERIESLFRERPDTTALSKRPRWRSNLPLVVATASFAFGTLLGGAYLATHSRPAEMRAHAVVLPQAMTGATLAPRREARGERDSAGPADFAATEPSSSGSRTQPRSADVAGFGGLR